jgi:hypothetical protein
VIDKDRRPWRAMDDARGDVSAGFEASLDNLARAKLIRLERRGGQYRIWRAA